MKMRAVLVGVFLLVLQRSSALMAQPAAPQGGACDLCKAIDDPRFAWLHEYAGRGTFDVTQDARFKDLVGSVAPGTTFHFRTDMPLAEAWTTILKSAGRPVTEHNSRYIWLSSCAMANCQPARGLAGLWVDALDGIAIGTIFFAPSNGEPTPALTIFAKQASGAVTTSSQLPAAFLQDLAAWSKAAGVPDASARYFIGNSGEKSVVPHDERPCAAAACTAADVAVAQKDLDATFYLLLAHSANGTPQQLALRLTQNLWTEAGATTCGGAAGDPACRVKFIRDRIHTLQTSPPR